MIPAISAVFDLEAGLDEDVDVDDWEQCTPDEPWRERKLGVE